MADVIMTIDSGNPLNHVGRAIIYNSLLNYQTLAPPVETKVDIALHEAKYKDRFDDKFAVNTSGNYT